MFRELEFKLGKSDGMDKAIGISFNGRFFQYAVFEGHLAADWEDAPRNISLGIRKSKSFMKELEEIHFAEFLAIGNDIQGYAEGVDMYHVGCICDDGRELYATGSEGDNLYLAAVEAFMSSLDRFFGTSFIPCDVIDSLEINFIHKDFSTDIPHITDVFGEQRLLHLQTLEVKRRNCTIRFHGRHPSRFCDFELNIYNEGKARQILDLFQRLVSEDGIPESETPSDGEAAVLFRLCFHDSREKKCCVPCRREMFFKRKLGDMMGFLAACISSEVFGPGILDCSLFA